MTATAPSSAPRPPLPGCRRDAHRLALVALVAWGLIASPGCVRRRLTVRSNPPGALLYVDNQQIGSTPCSVDFTYYGTREIRLVKAGYETLTVNQPIPAPWWQTPGVDFVADNLIPTKIRDNRTVLLTMSPERVEPSGALIARGQLLREQAQAPPAGAAFTPPPPVDPFLAPPAGPLPVAPPAGAPALGPTFGGPAPLQAAPPVQAPPGLAPPVLGPMQPAPVPLNPGPAPPLGTPFGAPGQQAPPAPGAGTPPLAPPPFRY